LFHSGELQVDDQISTCGKATTKTPLKLNKATGKESSSALAFSEQNWGACTRQYYISVAKHANTTLSEIVTMANALIVPTLEMLSDDGSLQSDVMKEELAMVADQHMGICRFIVCFINTSLTSLTGLDIHHDYTM
jgi:hypothetical protein